MSLSAPRHRASTLPALLTLLLPAVARAGPWLFPAGHGYVQLRQAYSTADVRFDANGDRAPVRIGGTGGGLVPSSWGLLDTTLYAEVSALSRLAFFIDADLLRSVWQPSGRRALGFSDLTLGAKLLIFDDVLTLTAVLAVTAPTGRSDDRLPLGEGDVRTEIGIMAGKLFEPLPFFVDVRVTFVLRGSATQLDPIDPSVRRRVAYSSEARYVLEGGYTLRTRRRGLASLTALIRLDGVYSTGAPVEDGLGLIAPPTRAFLRLLGSLAWRPIAKLELSVSGGGFVAGRTLPTLSEVAGAVAVLF